MHILGLLLAIVAGAVFWWWRLRMLNEAGREVVDQVGKVRGKIRRDRFRKAERQSVLAGVENPAHAAIVFISTLASEKPHHLAEAREKVRAMMGAYLPAAEIDEQLIFGEWVAGEVADVTDIANRFRLLWRSNLSEDEAREFVALARSVAETGGAPTQVQARMVQDLERAVLPG